MKLVLSVDSRFMSPYALSAFVALTEKELTFEVARVDLASRQQQAPAFGDRSLTGRVPMLEHGEFSLTESSAIAEYLDEAFPAPLHRALYPRHPAQRARARQVQAWLRSDLMPIRAERPTTVIFLGPVHKPLTAEAQTAADRLLRAAEAWIPHDGAHLFADWCIADTDLAVMLNRLAMNGDAVPSRLAAYARRQWERPSVQAWVARQRALEAAPA